MKTAYRAFLIGLGPRVVVAEDIPSAVLKIREYFRVSAETYDDSAGEEFRMPVISKIEAVEAVGEVIL